MNLIRGKLVPESEIAAVLEELPMQLYERLREEPLDAEVVISACDTLAQSLDENEILPILLLLDFSQEEARLQIEKLRFMFSRAYLSARLERELSGAYKQNTEYTPPEGFSVVERWMPLGVLFHIAAGNMDGLPVLTVIEGLLTGNINLLKLPSVDGGLSILILQRLFQVAPELAEYVYVFDMESTQTDEIRFLAELADAVVLWGGDEAVQAVRTMAEANTKLIEWGHKTSFAYVTQRGMQQKEALSGLARHICATNQLLCSSCQGVLLETQDEAMAEQFCKEFAALLSEASEQYPPIPMAAAARQTLREYAMQLEQVYGTPPKIWAQGTCSVVLRSDGAVSASDQFRHPWVRQISRESVIATLHPLKSHLQTASIICASEEREELTNLLLRAGVTNLMHSEHMSETYCGAPHDGVYTLQQYMKRVTMMA